MRRELLSDNAFYDADVLDELTYGDLSLQKSVAFRKDPILLPSLAAAFQAKLWTQ